MALQQKTNYEWLRSAYDRAFARLTAETRQLNHLHTQRGVETRTITQAEQKVADAERLYLQTRNALGDFLIAKKDQSPRQSQSASIEECAYFLWLNAGKPSGNERADWYQAETYSSF